MIQIIEVVLNEERYWYLFEDEEIIGKYGTELEAINATKEKYPQLDGVMIIPSEYNICK
jgi:hypothetical protein